MITKNDERYMREAVAQAKIALEAGEIPIGAVAVRNGEIVARAGNERESLGDPTAHAEILALRRAAAHLGTRRLSDLTLYVTLEPCAMCAGAVVAARIQRLVYGAYDPARGCAGSLYRLTEDLEMDWRCPAEGGALLAECEALLRGIPFAYRERPRGD